MLNSRILLQKKYRHKKAKLGNKKSPFIALGILLVSFIALYSIAFATLGLR